MSVVAIKIISKNDAEGAAEARGELMGGGFSIVYEDDADGLLVDANRAGGGEDIHDAVWIIVGKKD